MALQNLELQISVNSETGQLDVLGAKLKDTGETAAKTGQSFGGLGRDAGNLAKAFLPFASATAIVGFFAAAVKGAEEEAEAMRRLQFNLEGAGQSWAKNKTQVEGWIQSIQAATRFSDTQAIQTMERFVRVTGDVAQAQRASQLAMDLSVRSGNSLQQTTEFVTNLINGNSRAVMEARREYAAFVGDATNTRDILAALSVETAGAAANEESLTKATLSLKNQIADLGDQFGNTFAPAVSGLVSALSGLFEWLQKIGTALAGVGAMAAEVFSGMGAAVRAVFTGQFGDLREIARSTMEDIARITVENAEQIQAVERQNMDQTIRNVNETVALRGRVTDEERERQVREHQKQADLIYQIDQDLNQRFAAMDQSRTGQKTRALEIEVAAQRRKISTEVRNEQEKQRLLSRLDEYQLKRTQELSAIEVKIKRAASLDAMETALNALEIVNNMGDRSNKAQQARAKAILVLEKSIAIAKAIAAAQSAGPFAGAVAAANVALITAQFAQQWQAIGEAGRLTGTAQEEFRTTTDLGGGQSFDRIFREPDGTVIGGGGGGGVGTGAPAAGGGGGPQTLINVGGVTVNFTADHVDLAEIDVVARRLAEAVRAGTNEGVQLALAVRTQGERNAALAI